MTDAAAPPPTRRYKYSAKKLDDAAEYFEHVGCERLDAHHAAMLRQAASQARVLAGLRQWLEEGIEKAVRILDERGSHDPLAIAAAYDAVAFNATLAESDRLVAREGQEPGQ